MEIFLKDNLNEEISLNNTKSLAKSNENKDNKEDKILNLNEDKYLIKSDLLNIETKKLKQKNILEKTEENIIKTLNLKILVKSKYILKEILLILDDKRKLLLLRYNKYYKKLMGINLVNYQKLCGKIKTGGINGYGKEYEFDNLYLIFKGYYMNGKRNGKGIEYNGDIIFEGEYKNEIKNGKGIEYNKKGILFVGEYVNGKNGMDLLKNIIMIHI